MDKLQIKSPYEGGLGDLAMSRDPPLPPATAAPVIDMDFAEPVSAKASKLRERIFVINSRDRSSGTPQSYVVPLPTNPSERIVAAKIKSVHLPNDSEYLVDEYNRTFGLVLGDDTTVSVSIAAGDYANDTALAAAIETALDAAAATRTTITVASGSRNVGVVDVSGGSTLTASMDTGTYTPAELAAHLKTKLDALSGADTVFEITGENSVFHFKDTVDSAVHGAVLSLGSYSGDELATELQTAMNAVSKTGYFTIANPNHQIDVVFISGQTPDTVTLTESTLYSGEMLALEIQRQVRSSSNYVNFYTVSSGVNDTFLVQDIPGGSWETITLTAGTYDRPGLMTEIDTQLAAMTKTALYPVPEAQSYKYIRFRDMPSGPLYDVYILANRTYTGASLANEIQNKMNSKAITPRIKIGASNDDYTFVDISGGSDLTVTVPAADYLPADLASTLTTLIAAHGSRSSTIVIGTNNSTFQMRDKVDNPIQTVTLDTGEYTGATLATEIASKLNATTKTDMFTIATGTNDKIDFNEDIGVGDTVLVATLAPSTLYDGDDLAAEIGTKLTAAGLKGRTYTCTYDSGTKKFSITSSASPFNLLTLTGVNLGTSAFATLGFSTGVSDLTGLTTYTSDGTGISDTPDYSASFSSGKLTIETEAGFYLDLIFTYYPQTQRDFGYATIETGSESYVATNNLAVSEKVITVSYDETKGQFTSRTTGTFLTLKMSTANIAATLGYSATDKTGSILYKGETTGLFGTQSTFTVSYDGTDEFTISSNSEAFEIFFYGLHNIIGFDASNTGSTSYTSTSLVTGSKATITSSYAKNRFTLTSSGPHFGIDMSGSALKTLIGFPSGIQNSSQSYTGTVDATGTAPVFTASYSDGAGTFTFTTNTGFLEMDLSTALNGVIGFLGTSLTGSTSYTSDDGPENGSESTFVVSYDSGAGTFDIETNAGRYLSLFPKYGAYDLKPVLGFKLNSYSGSDSYTSDTTVTGSTPVYTVTYEESGDDFTISTSGSFLTLDFTVANAATGPLGFTAGTKTAATSYTSDASTSAASETFSVSASTSARSFTIASTSGAVFGIDFTFTDAGTLLGFDDKVYSGAITYTSENFYNLTKTRSIVMDIQQLRMISGTNPAIDSGTSTIFLEDSTKEYITLDSTHFPETFSIAQLSSVTYLKTFNIEFRHTRNGALYNFHGLDHIVTVILYVREA